MARSLLLLALLSLTLPLHAGNWPNWRGPAFNGSGAGDEKGLPTVFGPAEGIAWSYNLPGPAASTPAIWEDSVFLSAAVESEKKLYACCLERKTGRLRWKISVAEGFRADDKSNFASPSPVTDGKLAIFFYGTGDVIAFDFAGKEVWKKNLQTEYGRFATQWTFSSSPMLDDGRLYFQVLQRNTAFVFNGFQKGEPDKPNDSYLLALDPKTGAQLWKSIRPSDANSESLESFGSPIPFTNAGRKELLVCGGDCITGADPSTGKELWRWGTWNPSKIGHWRMVVSPVGGDGIVLACAPKREPIYAIKAGANGTVSEGGVAWVSGEDERKDVCSDVATPAFYKGRFYVMNSDRQSLSCVEPATGKVFWNERLDGGETRLQKFESSPTVADGKIYVIDQRGTVVVVAAEDTFKQLAVNPLGGDQEQFVRSSIAISHGQLFIRTNGRIFCVGKKE